MAPLDDEIRRQPMLRAALEEDDTAKANEALRSISADPRYGLGMALLVAWQHGLRVGHIPDPADERVLRALAGRRRRAGAHTAEVRVLKPDEVCPYVFVHVPVRQFRRDTPTLIELGIMNPNVDPAMLVYHEDGLVGSFSFANPERAGLADGDVTEILRSLARQHVLVRANIDNRQIQFKDLAVKRRIEASGKEVYVRLSHTSLDRKKIRLPGYEGEQAEKVWSYVEESLRHRFACNYCSVQALSPREVTINSALAGSSGRPIGQATVRNYQMGFTFSPFGNPGDVCHFAAWDSPHISDLVMNMEPQIYSFSDLIRLVRIINKDIDNFCSRNKLGSPPGHISGGCNHFAGNSIYHQHYQFARIACLPLVAASRKSERLVSYQGVEVRRMAGWWPAPAFLIRSTGLAGDEELMKVADKVAREWRVLSEDDDLSYGNEIVIRNHTQNIYVTMQADGELAAFFIPRLRKKKSTSTDRPIRKENAGVLEMMGYFVIDDEPDFDAIEDMTSQQRKALGDSLLSDLKPGESAIEEFERNVKVCLSTAMDPLEQRIDELLTQRPGDWRMKANDIVRAIQREAGLKPAQREHLYRELIFAVLEPIDGQAGEGAREL
jgi:hypothetical protein